MPTLYKTLRSIRIFVVAALAAVLVTSTAAAQPCGGTPGALGNLATQANPTVLAPLAVSMITTVAPATSCLVSFSHLTAQWPSAAARTGDAVGGCIFIAPSGTCRVANDGLPVELLSFGVN